MVALKLLLLFVAINIAQGGILGSLEKKAEGAFSAPGKVLKAAEVNFNKPLTSVQDFAKGVLPYELTPAGLLEAWTKFKKDFKRNYSPAEEIERQALFVKSYTDIVLSNMNFGKGFQKFKLSVNHLADATAEEFKKMLGVKLNAQTLEQLPSSKNIPKELTDEYLDLNNIAVSDDKASSTNPKRAKRAITIPAAIDWREKGTVGPVKNQGVCGSCYAFSSLGALEALYARTHGNNKVTLSEQQLVDCSESYGNEGCHGGLQEQVFKYIKEKGIVKSDAYNYTSKKEECKKDVDKNPFTSVINWIRVPKDEENLRKAVGAIGPVAISLDVSDKNFQLYSDGIYSSKNCSSTDLNHGVVVVGYGADKDGDYWLIRNSWSESWGQKGYMKLARNAKNMCGVATYAIYPKIKK